jgi:hypothetical protein
MVAVAAQAVVAQAVAHAVQVVQAVDTLPWVVAEADAHPALADNAVAVADVAHPVVIKLS